MPRKKLIKTDEYYYHITTRSNHGDWFQIPLSKVWNISIQAFERAQREHQVCVSQYVLMANHYHMLVRTPNLDIDRFMYFFNKTFSEKLRKASRHKNRMFGSNYKWLILTNQRYFNNTFYYIYQNPLRAGIVKKPEHYPYSSLFYTSRNIETPFPFKKLSHLENSFLENDLLITKEKLKLSA